jgi:hypothetical protein
MYCTPSCKLSWRMIVMGKHNQGNHNFALSIEMQQIVCNPIGSLTHSYE